MERGILIRWNNEKGFGLSNQKPATLKMCLFIFQP